MNIKMMYNNISKKRLILGIVISFLLVLSILSIMNMYALKEYTTIVTDLGDESGIYNNIVKVDNRQADLYYYNSLNFTGNVTKQSGLHDEYQQIYSTSSNLVQVNIKYSGVNSNTKNEITGYVSPTELQNEYEYMGYYPVTTCKFNTSKSCIEIELIDNPWSYRPTSGSTTYGFGGWAISEIGSDNADLNTKLGESYLYNDFSDYTRYLYLVVGEGGSSVSLSKIDVELKTVWVKAAVISITDDSYLDASYRNNVELKSRNFIGVSPSSLTNHSGYFIDATSEFANASESDYYLYYNATGYSCTLYDSGCGTGGKIFKMINSGTVSSQRYVYYFVTRDTNIVSLEYDVSGLSTDDVAVKEMLRYILEFKKPMTITSSYDGRDISTTNVLGTRNKSKAYEDLVIENVYTINCNAGTDSASSAIDDSKSLLGNYYNIKIGRHVGLGELTLGGDTKNLRTFINIWAGSKSNVGMVNNPKKFSLIVESGTYNTIIGSSQKDSTVNYISAKYILGSDYDRVTQTSTIVGDNNVISLGNNSNLNVLFAFTPMWKGTYYDNSLGLDSAVTTVKSGSFGQHPDRNKDANKHVYGLNISGRDSVGEETKSLVIHNMSRMFYQGGSAANVIGGPCLSDDYSGNAIHFVMTGGQVEAVFGGAGTETTRGNRFISILGGTVKNNVYGGSNGYIGSERDGRLVAGTYVYIGGNAVIGDSNSTSIYGAEVGDVFGAGAGNADNKYLGTVDSVHIVVNDKAIINGSVYGGGNYGSTGKLTANDTYTIVDIDGGTVKGSVYGSSNNNGSGSKGEDAVNKFVVGTTYYNAYGYVDEGAIIPEYSEAYERDTGKKYYSENYLYNDVQVSPGQVCSPSLVGYNTKKRICYYGTGIIKAGSDITSYINVDTMDNNYNLTDAYMVYQGRKLVRIQEQNPFYVQTSITTEGQDYTTFNWLIKNYFGESYGSEAHDIYVNVNGGLVEGDVFGGSNAGGTVFACVTVNLNGGEVQGETFGGGRGEKTYVSGDIEVNINDGFVGNVVYGGSSLGSVNAADPEENYQDKKVRDVKVNINGGAVNVLYGGSKGSASVSPIVYGQIFVVANGGNVGTIFGGNNLNGTLKEGTSVILYGGSHGDVYGGSNQVGMKKTSVFLNGATVNNIYGGSNIKGNVKNSTVYLLSGTLIGSAFGGNNTGGIVDFSRVIVNGGDLETVYGCGKGSETSCNSSIVLVSESSDNINLTNVYGGGEAASINDNVNIIVEKGTVNNIFGGSNSGGIVKSSFISITNGNIGNIYGGNNIAGNTVSSKINVGGGEVDSVYGGGKSVDSTDTFVNIYAGHVVNVYGAGESGGANNTNVNAYGGTIDNVFGGANVNGTVSKTNVNILPEYVEPDAGEGLITDANTANSGSSGSGSTGGTSVIITDSAGHTFDASKIKFKYSLSGCDVNFWAHNQVSIPEEKEKAKTYPFSCLVTITVDNPYDFDIEGYELVFYEKNSYVTTQLRNTNGNYYFQKMTADANVEGLYYISSKQIYAWGFEGLLETPIENKIPAGAKDYVIGDGNKNFWLFSNNKFFAITPLILFKEQFDLSNLDDEYDDLNRVQFPYVNVEYSPLNYAADPLVVGNIFGGNNAGGKTLKSNVVINPGCNVDTVFAGGNDAVTEYPNVIVYGGTVNNVYGGGKGANALVNSATHVKIVSGEIGNVFGGGFEGLVPGNTEVSIFNGHISGSVFGSGNKANTGSVGSKSLSTVNIYSGYIEGNVYGGANTGDVNGHANVYIGANAIPSPSNEFEYGKSIVINGTVFGGSEGNSSGGYDWKNISVTDGIDIIVDSTGYNEFDLKGSIFGSGNSSSSAGDSVIKINKLGTSDKIVTLQSIQRANSVYLINSNLYIDGAKDSTNDLKHIKYSFNHIDHLYLADNTSLYLKSNANLLYHFHSVFLDGDDYVEERVSIDDNGNITSKNVDNRLYTLSGKGLNVLTTQEVNTEYPGEVHGMTFLGMYELGDDGKPNVGIYDSSINKKVTDTQGKNELFGEYSGTYVLGKKVDDITVNGFYYNYYDADTNTIKPDYVDPEEDQLSYYWNVGVRLANYDVELIASRFSTLGVDSLDLDRFKNPDTRFVINSIDFGNLDPSVSIVDGSEIKKIADSSDVANSKFGIHFETSSLGWKDKGSTVLYSDEDAFVGTDTYYSDSTSTVPSILFYLDHSKNIELEEDETERELGYGQLIITAYSPVPGDEVNTVITTIRVNIKLFLNDGNNDGYSSIIAPGKQTSVFQAEKTVISSDSSFSIYQSLGMYLNHNDKNGDPWTVDSLYPEGSRRALQSNMVFPLHTTITMLDLVTNEYYYYTVTWDNVIQKTSEYYANGGEVSYYLSEFIKMGSVNPDNHYVDDHIADYYNADNNFAMEEFIFTVDFANNNDMSENFTNRILYLELLRDDGYVIMSPIGDPNINLSYDVYLNSNATLETTGTISQDKIYVGDTVTLNLNTTFNQSVSDTGTVYDSTFDDYKLGAKITIYDAQDNLVDGSSLLGLKFNINGKDYYPQTDGTTRINLAGKATNINSEIIVDTANTSLTNGEYKFVIETFGSYDGMYYGDKLTSTFILPITILNNKYGLNVDLPDNQYIHEVLDGTDEAGSRVMNYTIKTSSGLGDGNLRISLQRRKYTTAYDMSYELVDLKDYVTNELVETNGDREYLIISDVALDETSTSFDLELKDTGLKTGTYRVVFSMYDGDTYIGCVYKYLIIRNM